jgi:aromatic ring-opening dioxygenase catalytic subunit (LigB family)
MLAYPESQQRNSLLPFLRDFGPVLLKKYQPKGIVVFSAHWETLGERLGALNPRSYQGSFEIELIQ